jgi:hypothetical protein
LIFDAGNEEPTRDRGHRIILNSNYETLKIVLSCREMASADIRGLSVLGGGKSSCHYSAYSSFTLPLMNITTAYIDVPKVLEQ